MANMNLTDVDTALILDMINCLDDAEKKFNAINNTLSNNIMSELNLYWDGVAKNKFSQDFEIFRQQFDNQVKKYSALRNALNEAGEKYNLTEKTIINKVNQLLK